jgi:hypothetical protein
VEVSISTKSAARAAAMALLSDRPALSMTTNATPPRGYLNENGKEFSAAATQMPIVALEEVLGNAVELGGFLRRDLAL